MLHVATALAVTILRKETIIMHTQSPMARDKLINDFMDCIDRASTRMSSFIIFCEQSVLTGLSLACEISAVFAPSPVAERPIFPGSAVLPAE